MQTRSLPLRPHRLGARARRAPRGAQHVAGAGYTREAAAAAKRRGAQRRVLLDVPKHLATSVHQWAKAQESKPDRYKQKLHLQGKLLETMRQIYQEGGNAQRQRDFERLHNCQREWIGFAPTCCAGRPVAVPIGCNHRLCVLCNAHRAEHYRDRVRELFARLDRPQFLTLTIPSLKKLSKKSYSRVRWAVRKFIKQHAAWIKGGIYSLETTFHETNGWHLHVHILLDCALRLPAARADFIRFKRRAEFDWLRLTGGREWRESDFNFWFAATERPQSVEWNRENRRVIDVRPVRDRDGAAYEVLKYITKVTDFVHNPAAVEEFLTAVRGVRMLQTFGSWYGVKFEDDANKTWAHLHCECGQNQFKKIGKYFRDCVEMLPDGKWVVRREFSDGWIPPPVTEQPVVGHAVKIQNEASE